ncbi:MAG: DUF6580 family putative transport protein [bacterium]|jgi:hypothetical protein
MNKIKNDEIKNDNKTKNIKIFYIVFIIFLGIFYRLIPHPPNFSPLYSISVFSSILPIELNNKYAKYISFLIPIFILFITDLILSVHKTMIFNYFAFLSISLFSYFIFNKYNNFSRQITGVILSLISSIWFFIVSNFGVWLLSNMYSKDIQGLLTCYINALPFLGNSLISSIIFSIIIFYSYELIINVFLKGKDVKNVELN